MIYDTGTSACCCSPCAGVCPLASFFGSSWMFWLSWLSCCFALPLCGVVRQGMGCLLATGMYLCYISRSHSKLASPHLPISTVTKFTTSPWLADVALPLPLTLISIVSIIYSTVEEALTTLKQAWPTTAPAEKTALPSSHQARHAWGV